MCNFVILGNTYNLIIVNSSRTLGKNAEKSLNSSPDETRTFEKGKIEIANLGDTTIGRAILEPGWELGKMCKAYCKN
jgi:hypothetical protein